MKCRYVLGRRIAKRILENVYLLLLFEQTLLRLSNQRINKALSSNVFLMKKNCRGYFLFEVLFGILFYPASLTPDKFPTSTLDDL